MAAIDWLTRDLDDALLKFIDATEPGDQLLGCFYEFAYPPATDALLRAIARGVDVQLVIDEKDNAKQFPLEENQNELARSHFPAARVTARTARSRDIAHNKFMVLIRNGQPQQVWTGSTNLTPVAWPVRPTSGTGCAIPTWLRATRTIGSCCRATRVVRPPTLTPKNAPPTPLSKPRLSNSHPSRPTCMALRLGATPIFISARRA